MKKLMFILFLTFLALNLKPATELLAQGKKSQSKKSTKSIEKIKQEVIATIGSNKITYEELERAFQKNPESRFRQFHQLNKDSITDFLKLYLNYRLKVIDAERRGLHNDPQVKSDIETNRKILTETYFFEFVLVEPNVEELMERRKKDLQMAIILIGYPPNPEDDTSGTYEKAMNVLSLLKSGIPFNSVAMDYSHDKQAAGSGGVIPTFVTGGKVHESIENVLYNINPGEYYPELIFIQRYGYFIVKLVRAEPRMEVLGRHILISHNPAQEREQTVATADSLLRLVRKGADFAKLAAENSEDAQSKNDGGSLGSWYSRSTGFRGSARHIVPEFEEALFSMKDGEVSGLVESEFGFHIIRRDSSKPVNVELEKEELKQLYKRLYFDQAKRQYLDSLKNVYKFSLNENVLNELFAVIDTTKTNLDKEWSKQISENLRKKNFFEISNKKFTVNDFVKNMEELSELKGLPLHRSGINRSINTIVDPIIISKATENFADEYPEFGHLMKEFRDGILLFRIEALEVWDKLKFDSTLAIVYYDSTKSRFQTEPVYDITEIFVISEKEARTIYDRIKQGDKTFEELAGEFTQRAGFREMKGRWGKLNPYKHKMATIAHENNLKSGDVFGPFEADNGYSIIKINDYESSRQKTFEESISDLAPYVQEIAQAKLTKEWLDKVKKDVPVKINQKNLDKVISELKK